MTQLHVRKTSRVKHLPLEDAAITIGRAEHNVLVLPGDQVSRKHAVILVDDGTIRVEDLNSRNGLRVNGRAVKDAVIEIGDCIAIGPYEIVIGQEMLAGETGSASLPGASRSGSLAPTAFNGNGSSQSHNGHSSNGHSNNGHSRNGFSAAPADPHEPRALRLDKREAHLLRRKERLAAVTGRLEEKAAEVNARANHIEIEREDLRRERQDVRRAEQAFEAREADLAAREQQIEARQQELESREQQIAAREQAVAATRRDLEAREQSARAEHARLGTEAAALDDRTRVLVERQDEVDALAASLQITEHRLAELRDTLDADRVAWSEEQATAAAEHRARGEELDAEAEAATRRRADLDERDDDLTERETRIEEQLAELEGRHEQFEQARAAWDVARAELVQREATLHAELDALQAAVHESQQKAETAAEAEQRAEKLSTRLRETEERMSAEAKDREEAEQRLTDTETRLDEVFNEGRRIFVELRAKNKRLEHANNRAAWRKKRFDRLRDRHRTIVRTLSSFEKSALRLLDASQSVSALQKTVRDLQVQWMQLVDGPPMAEETKQRRTELRLRLDAARGARDRGVQTLQAQLEEFGHAAARERSERLGRRPAPPATEQPRSVVFPLPEHELVRAVTAAAAGPTGPAPTADDGYDIEP